MTEAEDRATLAKLEEALDSAKWWNWHADRDGGVRASPNQIAGIQNRINRLKKRLGLIPEKVAVTETQGLFELEAGSNA